MAKLGEGSSSGRGQLRVCVREKSVSECMSEFAARGYAHGPRGGLVNAAGAGARRESV